MSRDSRLALVDDSPSQREGIPTLELRAAAHHLGRIVGPHGRDIDEPASLEGFLWRVKPVSGALTRIYVSTHDGHIFIGKTARAYAPDPEMISLLASQSHPIAGTMVQDVLEAKKRSRRKKQRSTVRSEIDAAREAVLDALRSDAPSKLAEQLRAYRAYEALRHFHQINGADGYVDLRDIIECRQIASHAAATPSAGETPNPADGGESTASSWEDAAANWDEDDVGGEEGLERATDRAKLRSQRQLEVLLKNGRSIILEAFSKQVAAEWVERFNELVTYWKARDKADARLLTEADPSSGLSSVASLDARDQQAHLGSLWNWCRVQGCRTILKSGRLFRKWRTHQALSGRHLVLLQGRLLIYKLVRSTSSARARQNTGIFHRRQDTVIHLRDAYIYCGKLTEQFTLDKYEGATNVGVGAGTTERHTLPRIYRDGLRTFDSDEDCTFVIRYRPQRFNTPADPVLSHDEEGNVLLKSASAPSNSGVPLQDPRAKHIILRARSKMERDLWVRAIMLEIARIDRDDFEREERLRTHGQVPYKAL